MTYKHILWVDDFNDNDTSIKEAIDFDDLEKMNNGIQIEDEYIDVNKEEKNREKAKEVFIELAEEVEVINSITSAIDYIDKNFKYIDCVVLDVNLENTVDINDIVIDEYKKGNANKENILKRLEVGNVKLNQDELTEDHIKKNGGYYIFLYLLLSGFPSENVCIFTANTNGNNISNQSNTAEKWDTRFKEAHIKSPKILQRDDKLKLKDWIIKRFEDKSYLGTRLKVYRACEYWREKLSKIEEEKEEIQFNKTYYNNNKESYYITSSDFIDMFDTIEDAMPIRKPMKAEAKYYQILKEVTIFHEKSAKISTVNISKKRFHNAIRNFRNWSSHNQFDKKEIDADLFIYLFFIALRTYFEEEYDVSLPYEKFFKKFFIDDIIDDNFKNKYRNSVEEHLYKIIKSFTTNKDNGNGNKKEVPHITDITSILIASGNCRSVTKMNISDILLFIIDDYISIATHVEPKGCLYRIEYKLDYKFEQKPLEMLQMQACYLWKR